MNLRTFVVPGWQSQKLRKIAGQNNIIFPGFGYINREPSNPSLRVFNLYLKHGVVSMRAEVMTVVTFFLLAARCAQEARRSEHLNMLQLRADPATLEQQVVEWVAYPYCTGTESGNPPEEWPSMGDWLFENGHAPEKLLLMLQGETLT